MSLILLQEYYFSIISHLKTATSPNHKLWSADIDFNKTSGKNHVQEFYNVYKPRTKTPFILFRKINCKISPTPLKLESHKISWSGNNFW